MVAVVSESDVIAALVVAAQDKLAATESAVAASAFTITGATGKVAHIVNGSFNRTSEMMNLKQVYIKDGDADVWCVYGTDQCWSVTNTEGKVSSENKGFAATCGKGWAAPQLSPVWDVWSGHQWEEQPAVKIASSSSNIITRTLDKMLLRGTLQPALDKMLGTATAPTPVNPESERATAVKFLNEVRERGKEPTKYARLAPRARRPPPADVNKYAGCLLVTMAVALTNVFGYMNYVRDPDDWWSHVALGCLSLVIMGIVGASTGFGGLVEPVMPELKQDLVNFLIYLGNLY